MPLPATAAHVEKAVAAFHAAHAQRYGYATEERGVEVVTARLRGRLPGARLDLAPEPETAGDAAEARLADRAVWFEAEAPTSTACYARARLRPGDRFTGPALVFQYDTTLVVPPGWHAQVDAWRNVWIEQDRGR